MRLMIGLLTRCINTNSGFRKFVRSRNPGAGRKGDKYDHGVEGAHKSHKC